MSDPKTPGGTVSAASGPVTATADSVRRVATGRPAEVTDVGKGVRVPEPAPAPASPPPAPESVTVTEDIDFDALMSSTPRRTVESFEPGDKVAGVVEVISLHGQEIFLDLGGRATGYILKEELTDSQGNIAVTQGDRVEGIVVGTNSNGVHIRVKLGTDADSRALREAFEGGVPVEGRVMGVNKGGYDVLVAGQRAFCPHSQIDVHRLEDPESVVGQVLTFKVTELRSGGAVVSRAALLRAAQAERAVETMANLQVGARFTGHVRSIQKFGVFVDIGGVDGLIHVSELAWSRVDDPATVVKIGQKVEVVVTDVKPDKQRVGLSLKRAQGDPFEAAVGGLNVGDTINGTVVRLTDFGAFVTIAPDVDGLLHVSDMAHHRIRHPKELLEVGDTLSVRVMEIDLGRRRIGLSLKALMADPWDGIEARYPVGQTVKGRVEGIQEFGVFVTFEDGITALLPASQSATEGRPLVTSFKIGEEIEAKVLRVDVADKKMALTRREDAGRSSYGGGGGGGRRDGHGGGGRRDGHGGGGRRDGGGGRRDGGGGGGRRGTLAYSSQDEANKKGKEEEVGSLGALLLAAMKGKKE